MSNFDFEDINLVPKLCIVDSRSECSTDMVLGKYTFRLPVVPANMECVIDQEVAIKLASHRYFYIYHRFNNDTVEFSKKMKEQSLPISISLGVNEDSYKIIDELVRQNITPDFITIDIAHGHSIKMKNIVLYIYKKYPSSTPFIIAGNVSTGDAVRDLEEWGANAIKAGIGPGSACSTYTMTGFGSRGAQASTILYCSQAKTKPETKIIADGGIKEPGDIAKALALGADFVMVGGMFSGLSDSPGNLVKGQDGKLYKEFWGSASEFQSGKKDRIEGTKKLIPAKYHGYLDEMRYIHQSLQSAISYGGGKDLACLKSVKYILKKMR
jgi:GMP reductase